MKFSASLPAATLLACACMLWAGCFPPSRGQTVEEKEYHYTAGKNRLNAMDYAGAVKSFEKALEVNPRSAAAHFELGCLFLNHEKDPAAAIYHFQNYLKLSPGTHDAEVIKQHIVSCKQDLAKQVSLGPISATQQREFERMVLENKRLQEETRRLTQEIAELRNFISTNRPPVTPSPPPGRNQNEGRTPSTYGGGNSTAPSSPLNPGRPRVYVVRSGETMAAIARKHGVSVSSLQAANPGVDPRKIRAGQSIKLP